MPKMLQDDRSQILAAPPLSLVLPVAQILIGALKPTGHAQRSISFQPQSCQLEVMATQASNYVCRHVYSNYLPAKNHKTNLQSSIVNESCWVVAHALNSSRDRQIYVSSRLAWAPESVLAQTGL